MDDALDWPLKRELQGSPYLTVLYSSKVFDTLKLLNISNVPMMYAAQGAKLTPEQARRVCLRSGSKAYVTASVANIGNYYHIALSAQDCPSGKTLAKVERETSARNEIVKTLGKAGRQLRRELGEPEDSLRKFNTPLEDETSASLEALQALSEGIRLRFEQGNEAAIPQLKRAVELDPNLAVAYINLASAFDHSGEFSLGASYMTKAFNLRERLSQRSRWFIETNYYTIATGEMEKANATFVQWIQTFPADVYPHVNFAASLGTLGQHERAAVEAREAVHLMPNIPSYEVLLPPLIYMNHLEDANAVWNEVTLRGFDGAPSLRERRYWLAFLQRDQASMQEQLNWAMGNPGAGEGVLYLHSYGEAYFGHFRSAHRYLLQAIESARRTDPSNSGSNYESLEALWESEAGVVGARQRAINSLAKAPGRDSTLRLALALARAREATVAERVADQLDKEFPLSTVLQKFHLPTLRAAIELDRNNPGRAIEILQPTVPYELANTESFDELWPAYIRGLAYLQAGEGPQAVAEFQKLLDHSGVVGPCLTGALAHLQLGRAQSMMGDKAAARKSYQDFLTLWKDADPDIPIYKQAKAEYAKLQ
jgi:tetratricopeptide (TPR) repeat protein